MKNKGITAKILVPHMRHVITEKVSAKSMFMDIISCGLVVKTDHEKYMNSVFFFENKKVLFEYDKKTKCFWCHKRLIWSILEFEYSLNFQEAKSLIKDMVEKHFRLIEVTPQIIALERAGSVEKHFNNSWSNKLRNFPVYRHIVKTKETMKYEVIAQEEQKSEIIEESDLKAYRDKGYRIINQIPENIEDEDYLKGSFYPAHETWND